MPPAFADALLELLAAVFLPAGRREDVPEAAVRAMEAGLDSPSLRMIAGLSGRTNPFELESLARAMLDEMNLSKPDAPSLVRGLARPAARRFLRGEIDAGDFAAMLYDLSHAAPFEGHHPWCQLHDDWTLASEGVSGAEAEVVAALTREAEGILGMTSGQR